MPDENELFHERNQFLLPLMKDAVQLGSKYLNKGFTALDICEALTLAMSSVMMLTVPDERVQDVRSDSVAVFNDLKTLAQDMNIGGNRIVLSQVLGYANMLAYAANSAAFTVREYVNQGMAQVGDTNGSEAREE